MTLKSQQQLNVLKEVKCNEMSADGINWDKGLRLYRSDCSIPTEASAKIVVTGLKVSFGESWRKFSLIVFLYQCSSSNVLQQVLRVILRAVLEVLAM